VVTGQFRAPRRRRGETPDQGIGLQLRVIHGRQMDVYRINRNLAWIE
jgi:hypothetical protein